MFYHYPNPGFITMYSVYHWPNELSIMTIFLPMLDTTEFPRSSATFSLRTSKGE